MPGLLKLKGENRLSMRRLVMELLVLHRAVRLRRRGVSPPWERSFYNNSPTRCGEPQNLGC